MAGVSEECGVVEEVEESRGKRGLSGSMSLRTRKLGRRLSRSMSIVALKLPEKAHSITRSSSKLMRSGSRDKKTRSFELSIILPDKTQKQVMVLGNSTVAEVVCEPIQAAGAVVAGVPTGPLSAPLNVPLGSPLPPPTALDAPPVALLFLGGSKAPVEPRAQALTLEGEVLVVEYEPPSWDGKDLNTFIAWEKIYAATLFSAIELYGKPLLRAAVITKEEYHLLFYYLECVSEASEALTERMQKYIDSGLLMSDSQDDKQSIKSKKSLDKNNSPMLNELIQEGIITQRDVDVSSEMTNSVYETSLDYKHGDSDDRSNVSSNSVPRKVIVDIPIDCNESISGSSIIENSNNDNITTVTINSGGQCCRDHRLSADVTKNIWASVKWEFINPADLGYDQIRSVKRSRSESALTPIPIRRSDDIYETIEGLERESECESITPYESIEDLYDCIKNAHYNNVAIEESTPSTENNEPQYPDYYEKESATRQSSTSSERSGGSSAFTFSKCGSSISTGAFASCESNSGISTFATKSLPGSLNCRELPEPPDDEKISESAILLKQLFMGELMDAYGEYLSAYPFARALLRRKARRDEHFTALADIRRGAAKYTIADYLELPVSAKYS